MNVVEPVKFRARNAETAGNSRKTPAMKVADGAPDGSKYIADEIKPVIQPFQAKEEPGIYGRSVGTSSVPVKTEIT